MADVQPTSAEIIIPPINSDNSQALKIFGGSALLLLCVGILSYWVPEYRAVVVSNIGVLIGAAAMYLKGK